MILKGNSRAYGQELARHLLNAEDNEHIHVHEMRGFMTDDLFGAFKEVEAISSGTKCQQYLFSLSLSPPQTESVSVEVFEAEIANIEKHLGLSGQPRAIVFHEKKGRRHAHCVWSRIDAGRMQAINLSHYKYKLRDISRELYRKYGWEMPAGLRDRQNRDPLNYSHAEDSQAKRQKCDPAELKAMFRKCWDNSDSQKAFASALLQNGFCLSRGDRRGFVAVDAHGEVYSLSRWCGVKSKILRARLDASNLPTVEEAQTFLQNHVDRVEEVQSLDRQFKKFDDKLTSLIERQRSERSALQQTQQHESIALLIKHQNALPTGLKEAWARLTGRYQEKVEEFATAKNEQSEIHALQTQAIVERHLAERRALDEELEFLKAKKALEQEFYQHTSSDQIPYQLDPRQPLILPPEVPVFTIEELKDDPSLILDHIAEKEASFTRNDITRELAKFIDDPLDLQVAGEKALISSKLVKLRDDPTPAFTTQNYQSDEQQLLKTSSELSRSGGFKVTATHIKKAIKQENKRLQKQVGANLSQEQIGAIQHVLKPNQLSSVVGLAGTGKSTLLSVARKAWEAQGYKVHGIALAGKAADSLESSSGISSRTIASLEASWKSGYEPVGAGDIVVLDEAGMVGTRQMQRITEQLQMRGCKLVLVGDPAQLQPIEAGTPFKNIIEQNGAARLSEIRRQKSEWQRQASSDLANGNIEMALRNYSDNGAVHEAESRDHAITNLVDDYIADWKTHGNNRTRLALAHRRKDVHAINQTIRASMREQGHVTEETLFETEHGPRAFAAGDRLLFTRNDRDLGVKNGMLATVKQVSDDQISVMLDNDTGGNSRIVSFSPSEFSAFDHGYAVTIHRAQGCTVDRSFVLSSKTMDSHLSYVALTRHKSEVSIFAASEIKIRQEKIQNNREYGNPLRGRSR
jgi:hypothetical protein